MSKVILDPGHGGNDPGAVHFGRQEKDDTLRLTLAIGDLLEKAGIDVVYTRTSDVYHTPFERADIANKSEGDYFVVIHRNTMLIPNSGSGVQSLVFEKTSQAEDLADNIDIELQNIGLINLGTVERPSLVTLRKTKMPAVWVEVGFIDNQKDNQFFDENFDEIAAAVAKGIMEALSEEDESLKPLYRVQAGAFRTEALADELLTQLQMQGFPTFLIHDDSLIKIQVGAFSDLEDAVKMERTLRNYGYNTFITNR